MTYSYNPEKIMDGDLDQMRFELGDMEVAGEADTCALCDEEYKAILRKNSGKWKRAKLTCLESIYRRFAYESDIKTGPVSFYLSKRAELWKQMYEDLKKEVPNSISVPLSPSGASGKPYFYENMLSREDGRM